MFARAAALERVSKKAVSNRHVGGSVGGYSQDDCLNGQQRIARKRASSARARACSGVSEVKRGDVCHARLGNRGCQTLRHGRGRNS
jgi:hypothetical protein